MPDLPRVAYLTSARTWRGSAVSYGHIAQGLAARGWHARMFSAAREVTLRAAAEGIPCTELPVEHTSIRAVRRLRQALREHAIDVLVVDKRRDVVHGAAASTGLPVALVARFLFPRWETPGDPLFRAAYRRVDLTNFLTAGAVTHVAERAPFVLRRPHVVIHEGVDAGRFRPDPAAAANLRRRLELGDGPLILGVGALEVEKGYATLVAAVGALPAPRPILLIVGTGSARGALAAEAAGVGVDLRLPGNFQVGDLAAAYAAATVFAHPSRMEAFGLSVAEAMAAGCPVVAARAGSLPEVVGDAGVLVPADDPAALTEQVRRLLSDSVERRELGHRARGRVLELFGLERMQGAHADALESAARQTRRG